ERGLSDAVPEQAHRDDSCFDSPALRPSRATQPHRRGFSPFSDEWTAFPAVASDSMLFFRTAPSEKRIAMMRPHPNEALRSPTRAAIRRCARSCGRAVLACVLGLSLLPSGASAQTSPPTTTSQENPGDQNPDELLLPVTTSDDGVLLNVLIHVASEKTGRTFLLPPEQQAKPAGPGQKIILTNVQLVPRKDLFEYYKAILKAN